MPISTAYAIYDSFREIENTGAMQSPNVVTWAWH